MTGHTGGIVVDPYPRRHTRLDLLTWPVLGRFLKWRHARTALQIPLLLAAGLMVFDGLFGPQLAPKNLATVGVWLQYRGLVVLALLVAGNLFCMACPFMLPRRLGRWLREHWLGGGANVPHWLRHKWVAVGLLVIFFYAYERFSLWSSPWLTAWIIVGYFLTAFVIDTCFKGAAFCKYVCPLGQFNFFGSLASPLEVRIRTADVCATCHTKDCITAPRAESSATWARGCELWLFQERKIGNQDCTFCLDCVHACPHDNIGIIGRAPLIELWNTGYRSGVGQLSRRLDLLALVAVLAFAGFVNAFAMIPPVYALRDALATGLGSPELALALIFVLGLLALPALVLSLTGLASRYLSDERRQPLREVIGHYVYALVPISFGMWLAHYAFHFLTGGLTIVPVIQSFLADVGLFEGRVQWELGPLAPYEWLFPIEAFVLYLGTFGSLVVAGKLAGRHGGGHPEDGRKAFATAAPWMVLCLLMLAAGLWILVQPMEMRGTMMMVGGAGG